MSASSRTKGQAGERELALLLSELTGHDVRRRVRQHDGDSDLEGVPGWSVEVKRYSRATASQIEGWWIQAVQQARAAKALPVLFYRLDRAEWRAAWLAGIHLPHRPVPVEYGNTLTADPATWWAMAQTIRR